uniref:Uracil-DNA glycosylase-like domain-containing protein n=1 Tax=Tenacibaculum sp. Pbs-1 TaxID=3238748 RepID=A0AB33L280_9FLAO
MNSKIEFYNNLKKIITNNILNIPEKKIDEMYDTWLETKDIIDVKKNFVYSDKFIHNNQNIPQKVTLKGIDLPTWFGCYNNKKIVVLGIDPRRNENHFLRDKANIENDVIVGTPYAFHEKETRESWCASYWTFINGLVEMKNFVYCTSIFKTYYYNTSSETRSHKEKCFVEKPNHLDILNKELELIKPDLIIAFGGVPYKNITKKNCPISQDILKTKTEIQLKYSDVDVYVMMNLSKATRGKNMEAFFKANEISTDSINVEDRVECAEKYIELLKNKNIIS